MKRKILYAAVVWLAIVLAASSIQAQVIFQLQSGDIEAEILSEAVFEERFGANPEIPRSHKTIVALARKLYPPSGSPTPSSRVHEPEMCGEHDLGLLVAALKNPKVSDVTRRKVDRVMAAAIPPLLETYSTTHYKFFFTSSDDDPKHNVDPEEVKAVAEALEIYWDKYSTAFTAPKHFIANGKPTIAVRIYSMGSINGLTCSDCRDIKLSSEAVRDACYGKTVPAHELFHRVQYSYGYDSGTIGQGWLVEGTACWSQKFTNMDIRDYMDRMNRGLPHPELSLTMQRAYDATHFWVYLAQRAGGMVIRDVWREYQQNGLVAKDAVDTVCRASLGKSFEEHMRDWHRANYYKDLDNPGPFGYLENEIQVTPCDRPHGPLRRVGRSRIPIGKASNWGRVGWAGPRGAEYYECPLSPSLTNLAMTVAWPIGDEMHTKEFDFDFVGIKGNRAVSLESFSTNAAYENKLGTTYTYEKRLAPGEWDTFLVIVGGRRYAGDYFLQTGTTCIKGSWLDDSGFTWSLAQSGMNIKGSVNRGACKDYKVNGYYTVFDDHIFLGATSSEADPYTCCPGISFDGTVTECGQISGSWHDNCGGSGGWTMSKP